MNEILLIALGFAAGLIVGWNLLPQPAWIKDLYDRASDKLD
jgi:hypothetical protein